MEAGMDRREFSRLVAGTAASALVNGSAFAFETTASTDIAPIDPKASDLYKRSFVLDCNSSPPGSDTLPLAQSDLDMARNCGVSVVKLSLGGINSNFNDTIKQIADVHQLIEVHPAYFMQ